MYDDDQTILGQGRPGATLVIRQGPQAGMSFPLSSEQATLGREEGLEIVLQDPESSRRHAMIVWQSGQYIIEDLGSTNGTFVNGVQITSPQILNPGDSIGIGQTALVFQFAGYSTAAPPDYQQTPSPRPVEPPPATSDTSGSKMTQYALYGCGCLLLVAICALLAVAVWIIFNQDALDNILSSAFILQESAAAWVFL